MHRDTKVGNLGDPSLGRQDVRAFDVSVQNTLCVKVFKPK